MTKINDPEPVDRLGCILFLVLIAVVLLGACFAYWYVTAPCWGIGGV